jgi:hypothetical protein
MSEQLTKLCPDRDLQCYYLQPSAIAALSQTSATGFTVSGCWRQQFDWAVIEWNRDNVFEHPTLRNLPDGDLSGVHLNYQETRTGCIPMDSALYPTVAWPYLRVWADSGDSFGAAETIYYVNLAAHATPAGSYTAATAQMQLQGVPSAGDYVQLAWLDQHFYYQIQSGDTLASAATNLAAAITAGQATGQVTAAASGTLITLTYLGQPGSNGNRVGVYGTVSGAGTESWTAMSAVFGGGVTPATWQITLDFSNLLDTNGNRIPTTNVRKLRWTYAADMQAGSFARSEFSVVVAQWQVTGTNLQYSVAGTGSRRIEDVSSAVIYQGSWSNAIGNYSGGSIHWTTTPGASLTCSYSAAAQHSLYLGTRCLDGGAQITVQVDNNPAVSVSLELAGEDVLTRVPLGTQSGAVTHSVTVTHSGATGASFYFDFLEMAYPASALPTFATVPATSLATDWDTEHSLALAPERTAWLIQTLGFRGRVNHYAGALWFYELCGSGQQYASATITFTGTPQFASGAITELYLGPTLIQHTNLLGDTAESIAVCLALLVNVGSTGVWASANGATLTITSRQIGLQGNSLSISVQTNSQVFTGQASGSALTGGADGKWVTDLSATPRLNRAARDWSSSYFGALKGYGIEVTTSFSMELGNGDDSTAAGIAQRYPDGDAVWVSTPALQTNFSPQSTAFWQQAYADMAAVMDGAGLTPYLQFGEVQWWYFADASGMPFYDSYTTTSFQQTYHRQMAVIASQNADPSGLADECAFLSQLIGTFTSTIMAFVRQSYSNAIFEVLYPPDTNDTALNQLVNFPKSAWTAANLACLKTENFTYTGDRNLDQARQSIELPMQLGFPPAQASHLTGIGDYTTPWAKERRLAIGAGVGSVVLFALDQFCLIGYGLPLENGPRIARFQGA